MSKDIPASPPHPEVADCDAEQSARHEVSLDPSVLGAQRMPRIGRMVMVGALLGIVIGLVTPIFGDGTTYQLAIAIILAVGLGTVGAFCGGGLALILEARGRRRVSRLARDTP